GRAGQGGGDGVVGAGVEDRHRRAADPERGPHGLHDLGRRGLVEAQPDVVDVDGAQVQLEVAGGVEDLGGPAGHPHGEGVEEGVVEDVDPTGAQTGGADGGEPVDAGGDP